MCDLPHITEETQPIDSFSYESLFLISTFDPWYGYLILYLHTQRFHSQAHHDKHLRIPHHDKYYHIVNDTLYHRGIDAILRCCLMHEEAEIVLNDSHSRACNGNIFSMDNKKILHTGYL